MVSCLGMGLFVYFEQILWIHVRIPLRRRQARVAQELLDGTQIASPLEQMSREGMAQSVRAGLRTNVGTGEAPGDDPSDRSVGKRFPSRPFEQRF